MLASLLFLAGCSLLGLALAERRCHATAAAVDEAFRVARAGAPGERLDVSLEVTSETTTLVVTSDQRGSVSRQELDRRTLLAVPAEASAGFLDGRPLGEPRAWLCMNPGTGSAWRVLPEGGVEGGSRLVEWVLSGFGE